MRLSWEAFLLLALGVGPARSNNNRDRMCPTRRLPPASGTDIPNPLRPVTQQARRVMKRGLRRRAATVETTSGSAHPGVKETSRDACSHDDGSRRRFEAGTRRPRKRNCIKITSNVNQVMVPVMVKDDRDDWWAGCWPGISPYMEDGDKQKLEFFHQRPLSSLGRDLFSTWGCRTSAVQKVNKTFPSLQGAFSQFDEVSLFTYSSTYSKVKDFTGLGQSLTEVLNELKAVRGRNNGPPILGGPLGPQGPTINNIPVDPGAPTVNTPPREAHVLNDAVLAAAIDLSKRDRARRKIIFIITDGREYGSNASYSDVLKVLLSNGIMVYGIGVEGAAIPIYGKLQQKIRLPKYGYGDILPKYANATGGEVTNELSQADIDKAYARVIGDARNQYTLGYVTRATPSGAYRQVEVRVDRPGCKSSDLRPCVDVTAKDGYYPLPPSR